MSSAQHQDRPRNRRGPRFSYKAGEKGRNRVRAFQDAKSGRYYLEFYSSRFGEPAPRRERVLIPSNEPTVAKRKADELAAELAKVAADRPQADEATLHSLFDNYLRETSGRWSDSKRAHDERAAEMFLRFFGARTKPKDLNRLHWDRFIAARRRGEIAPKHAKKGRTVGERVIAYDLTWLMTVLNWATVSGADGRHGVLLERNPLKGLPLPRNESPKRAVLTEEQYGKMLEASADIGLGFRLALVLAHETGHRIGSIRLLRWSDLNLDGARVRWRAENDKRKFEHTTPLTDDAVKALRDARAAQKAVGEAWVFPAPGDASEPCSRHLMRDWWERAAAKAKLPQGERYGWHSLRRKFATELKETDLRNLCHLGGWKNHNTVLTCYMAPDEERQVAALAQRQQRRATGAK
jgi:integrase